MIVAKKFFLALLITFSVFTIVSCKKDSGGGTTNNPPVVIPPATPVWDTNALRGTWVTTTASTALDSRANIKNMLANCKAANINNIFVVVYNQARTMYPSTVMNNLIGVPILERFASRDPLQECIEEAKPLRIKVHAWFEYGFASSYSANGGPIVAAKPAWAAKTSTGNLCVKNGFDWLNALHPEVQHFMIDLFKEVVTKYDIDGVQGDDRLPAMPASGGYDAYTINLYQSENGVTPPTNNADGGWVRWRANKLNNFVKRLRNEVKTIKPTVQFTISPSAFPWGLQEYLQDWPTWVDSGWVDAILPQCYRYDIAAYSATVDQQKSYYKNPAIPFYPGVILKSGSTIVDNTLLTQFIQKNRAVGFKGESFFFYEGIKDRASWFSGVYPFTK